MTEPSPLKSEIEKLIRSASKCVLSGAVLMWVASSLACVFRATQATSARSATAARIAPSSPPLTRTVSVRRRRTAPRRFAAISKPHVVRIDVPTVVARITS